MASKGRSRSPNGTLQSPDTALALSSVFAHMIARGPLQDHCKATCLWPPREWLYLADSAEEAFQELLVLRRVQASYQHVPATSRKSGTQKAPRPRKARAEAIHPAHFQPGCRAAAAMLWFLLLLFPSSALTQRCFAQGQMSCLTSGCSAGNELPGYRHCAPAESSGCCP